MTGFSADARVAADDALRAAHHAGVQVRLLHERSELADLLQLFDAVWSLDPSARPVSKDTLRALAHAGNPILGAFADDEMVGGSLGLLGSHGPAGVHVHSHMTGVHPDHQHRRIGRAVKLQQRAWALTHGIDTITWTFDPLVRRNGWFNLQVLGTTGEEYLVDFYGPLADSINGNDETDRLLVRWDLVSERVGRASTSGSADEPLIPKDTPCVLAPDEASRPTSRPSMLPSAYATVIVPDDIVAIRRRDPGLARAWRVGLREVLSTAFDHGAHVAGMHTSSDGLARYVLAPSR